MALFKFRTKKKTPKLPEEEIPVVKTAEDFKEEWERNRQVSPPEVSTGDKVRAFIGKLLGKNWA